MKKQLKSIGLSIDWEREISTCNDKYYKHQQKLLLIYIMQDSSIRKIAMLIGILLMRRF